MDDGSKDEDIECLHETTRHFAVEDLREELVRLLGEAAGIAAELDRIEPTELESDLQPRAKLGYVLSPVLIRLRWVVEGTETPTEVSVVDEEGVKWLKKARGAVDELTKDRGPYRWALQNKTSKRHFLTQTTLRRRLFARC